MLKRVIVACCTLCLAFSVVACSSGGDVAADEEPTAPVVEEEVAQEEVVEEEEVAQEEVVEEEVAEEEYAEEEEDDMMEEEAPVGE